MRDAVRYIGVDLGASSGRVLAGMLHDGGVELAELHRFENRPVRAGATLYWDVLSLWAEIQQGLRAYVSRFGREAAGIGIDTWGVDFAMVGGDGCLLGNPVHYRDRRTEGADEAVFARVSRDDLYETTGIQHLPFNTIFQLMAMIQAESPLLSAADGLLFIPDLLNFWLTGCRVGEVTIASTSQMLDARTRQWADGVVAAVGIERRLMPSLVEPGTVIGTLLPGVADDVGLFADVPVIAPACHDTGSAVAAVPARADTDWAYISSGTWSLMGVELPEPLMTDRARDENFTNEAGVCGTTRFLKNIAGLWLMQECRRVWRQRGQDYSYAELAAAAGAAEPYRSLVVPDAACFLAPPDMPAAIAEFCRSTGQPVPETPGQFTRCVNESLALTYRQTLRVLRELTDRSVDVLHVVGGGSRDAMLCQATADACGVAVVAGPAEATAVGNILVQAMGTGRVASLADLRDLARVAEPLQTYEPRDTGAYGAQVERFERLRALQF